MASETTRKIQSTQPVEISAFLEAVLHITAADLAIVTLTQSTVVCPEELQESNKVQNRIYAGREASANHPIERASPSLHQAKQS